MRTLNLFIILLALICIISIILYKINPYGYEVFNGIKPATYFQYSAFLLFALLLFKYKHLFQNLNNHYLNIFIIVAFGLLMATGYEMLWSFGVWFSINSVVDKENVNRAVSLDALTFEPTPNEFVELKQRNLNFISKKNTLFFFMSLYFLYFLNNLRIRKSMGYISELG